MRGKREDRIAELDAANTPWPQRTLWTLFQENAAHNPGADFLVFENAGTFSYGQVSRMAEHAAAGLAALGIRRGSHVALKSASRIEAVVAAFALARLGAVSVLLNAGMGAAELSYVLLKADCAYLICDEATACEKLDSSVGLKVLVAFDAYETPGMLDMPDAPDAPDAFETIEARGKRKASPHGAKSSGHPDAGCDSAAVADEAGMSGAAFGMRRDSVPLVFWQSLMRKDHPALASCPAHAQDPVNILFTSGSTGNPKGVPIMHDRLLRSAYCNCLNRGFEHGRRVATALPLHHCFAWVEGLVSVLFVGGAMLFSQGKFKAARFLSFARDAQANDVLVVPYMAARLCEAIEAEHGGGSESAGEAEVCYRSKSAGESEPCGRPESAGEAEVCCRPASSLHAMYCAGEFYAESLRKRIHDSLGVSDVVDGYGMTEVCGAAVQSVPQEDSRLHPGALGAILPAGAAGKARFDGHVIEYRAVDPETLEPLAPGKSGELCCRGLTVMDGYYSDAEATKNAFTPDGWLKTGDLGRVDAQGYVWLEGRMGDCYRINGENVSSRFVERIVAHCPGVEQAVVVGVPDTRLGAVGALFVQAEGDEAALERVRAFCREQLASFQVPKYLFAVNENEWPRTASGKVARARLRDYALAHSGTKAERFSSRGRIDAS